MTAINIGLRCISRVAEYVGVVISVDEVHVSTLRMAWELKLNIVL